MFSGITRSSMLRAFPGVLLMSPRCSSLSTIWCMVGGVTPKWRWRIGCGRVVPPAPDHDEATKGEGHVRYWPRYSSKLCRGHVSGGWGADPRRTCRADLFSFLGFARTLHQDDEVVLEATGNRIVVVRLLEPHVGRVTLLNGRCLARRSATTSR